MGRVQGRRVAVIGFSISGRGWDKDHWVRMPLSPCLWPFDRRLHPDDVKLVARLSSLFRRWSM